MTFDAIKRSTAELQDALYTRRPMVIRQQVEVAMEQNKAGEGPSSKAILQAEAGRSAGRRASIYSLVALLISY